MIKITYIATILIVICWAVLNIWREASLHKMYTALMVYHVASNSGQVSKISPEISKYFDKLDQGQFTMETFKLDWGMRLAHFPVIWFHSLCSLTTLILVSLIIWQRFSQINSSL
jgi:hypothetical protein